MIKTLFLLLFINLAVAQDNKQSPDNQSREENYEKDRRKKCGYPGKSHDRAIRFGSS